MEDIALKTTLAADVHTYGLEGKVFEETTGKVDLIIVACPMPDGKAFLAVGPVLSYYEFKQPMTGLPMKRGENCTIRTIDQIVQNGTSRLPDGIFHKNTPTGPRYGRDTH
jgi:hypothetical protein